MSNQFERLTRILLMPLCVIITLAVTAGASEPSVIALGAGHPGIPFEIYSMPGMHFDSPRESLTKLGSHPSPEHVKDHYYFCRGILRCLDGQAEAGLKDLETPLLEMRPALLEAWIAYAKLQARLHDEPVLSILANAELKDDPWSQLVSAIYHRDMGDEVNAIVCVDNALRCAPTDKLVLNEAASIHIAFRRDKRAVECIRTLIRNAPAEAGGYRTNLVVSDEHLECGRKELNALLRDRLILKPIIERVPELMRWLEVRFSGAYAGAPIRWHPTFPSNVNGLGGYYTPGNPIKLGIAGNIPSRDTLRSLETLPDYLASTLVFELLNAESSNEVEQLFSKASAGTITRDEFVKQVVRTEYEALKRRRAFFVLYYFDWAYQHEVPTEAYNWQLVLPDFDAYYERLARTAGAPEYTYVPVYDRLQSRGSRNSQTR